MLYEGDYYINAHQTAKVLGIPMDSFFQKRVKKTLNWVAHFRKPRRAHVRVSVRNSESAMTIERMKRVQLGRLPNNGYYKDHQRDRVMECFGFSKGTLANYRKGQYDPKKKRLYALLMSLPPSLIRDIEKEIKL